MAKRRVHPIILCGGAGSRLWPESTPERPKAFLALTGSMTMLQETALRLARVDGAAPPLVVASAAHAQEVRGEFADLDLAFALVTEPQGRGSAPAIAAACLEILDRDAEAVVLVAACDHHIVDAPAFADGVLAALALAADGFIVTFGVRPTKASSAYGYIRPGEAMGGGARRVDAFIEKPEADRAGGLVAAGALWNSGVFVFAARILLAELEAREPGLMTAVRRARQEGARREGVLALSDAFLASPSLAIDVAVMEKTDRAAVLPVDYGWSDLGAWDAVLEASEKDDAGNATRGAVKLVDSRGCMVRAEPGMQVVVVGLTNVAVVVAGGRVLVTDLSAAQRVRDAAEGDDERRSVAMTKP